MPWRAVEKASGRDPYPDRWTKEDENQLQMMIMCDANSFVKFNKRDIEWLQKKKRSCSMRRDYSTAPWAIYQQP